MAFGDQKHAISGNRGFPLRGGAGPGGPGTPCLPGEDHGFAGPPPEPRVRQCARLTRVVGGFRRSAPEATSYLAPFVLWTEAELQRTSLNRGKGVSSLLNRPPYLVVEPRRAYDLGQRAVVSILGLLWAPAGSPVPP